jgi:hypothetical protein
LRAQGQLDKGKEVDVKAEKRERNQGEGEVQGGNAAKSKDVWIRKIRMGTFEDSGACKGSISHLVSVLPVRTLTDTSDLLRFPRFFYLPACICAMCDGDEN